MAFETVKKNLEARGFSVQTFATAAEATTPSGPEIPASRCMEMKNAS